MSIPDWLNPSPIKKDVPTTRRDTPERRALSHAQYEMVFPRVLERMYSGETLARAVSELPLDIDVGAFTAWMYKNPSKLELYREAKEIRTEAWTGSMVSHALGEDNPDTLDRSKFIVDTYKWLISKENKKQYGDSKTIELNTTISITAALSAAQGCIIEVLGDDNIDLMDEADYKQLSSGDEENDADDAV